MSDVPPLATAAGPRGTGEAGAGWRPVLLHIEDAPPGQSPGRLEVAWASGLGDDRPATPVRFELTYGGVPIARGALSTEDRGCSVDVGNPRWDERIDDLGLGLRCETLGDSGGGPGDDPGRPPMAATLHRPRRPETCAEQAARASYPGVRRRRPVAPDGDHPLVAGNIELRAPAMDEAGNSLETHGSGEPPEVAQPGPEAITVTVFRSLDWLLHFRVARLSRRRAGPAGELPDGDQ